MSQARTRPAERRGRRGRSGVVFTLVALLLVLAVLGGGALLYGRSQLDAPGTPGDQAVAITVTNGESVETLISELSKHNLIRSDLWFGLYAKLQGLRSRLVAGTYQLNDGMTASAVIAALEVPPVATVSHKLVLPEGLNAAQMADRVAKAGLGITADQYLAEARTGVFTEPFLAGRPAGASLEGFLFPDTYDIPDHSSAHDVIQLQLADFAKRTSSLIAGKSPQQVYDIVISASIVEREAQFPVDRPLVASVLVNRLADGTALQVDSAVLYGLGLTSGPVTTAQLHKDTPYNTYLHQGLTPTPIANPGLSSLTAAATPAQTSYLYFVSDACGHNHFSVGLRQHEQQIAQYIGKPCPSPT